MALNLRRLTAMLAANRGITDYDLWHMRRRLEDELFGRRRRSEPVPIDLLYARRAVIAAQARKRDKRR